MSSPQPHIQAFFDQTTSTISYLVFDAPNGHAAIIDPVLNYQANSGTTSTQSAEHLLQFIAEQNLTVDWILETHAHADHLSAAHFLKEKTGAKIGISAQITRVQQTFKTLLNLESTFAADGSQFDHLFQDGEVFHIGQLSARTLYVTGHTPADMAYKIGDAIFVGDTLFMPDVGTARCDFPGGSAKNLYHSIRKILAFPENTRLFMCHDYPPTGRDMQYKTSVQQQRLHNIHINDKVDEAAFVRLRETRDATLSLPNLILPAIQINIRAGQFPQPESNGVSYLKIPLNQR
jgi:glyoxylase-like metal-dependent hydrolase (beta-lactamase superfamily II)